STAPIHPPTPVVPSAPPGSIPANCQKMIDHYQATYRPETAEKQDQLDDMIDARWRICRIGMIQSALLDVEMVRCQAGMEKEFSKTDRGVHVTLAFRDLADESQALSLANRYEARLRRAYDRARRNLKELQRERNAKTPVPPPAPAPAAVEIEFQTEPKMPPAAGPTDKSSAVYADPTGERSSPWMPMHPLLAAMVLMITAWAASACGQTRIAHGKNGQNARPALPVPKSNFRANPKCCPQAGQRPCHLLFTLIPPRWRLC
ncbi:MAG: hypothetical protein ABIZ80_09425, partial [Bryobacteraceae bacterium]